MLNSSGVDLTYQTGPAPWWRRRFARLPLGVKFLLVGAPYALLGLALPLLYLHFGAAAHPLERVDRAAQGNLDQLLAVRRATLIQSAALHADYGRSDRHWLVTKPMLDAVSFGPGYSYAVESDTARDGARQMRGRLELRRGVVVYSLKAPLVADESCQPCHRGAYRPGELVGWFTLCHGVDRLTAWETMRHYLPIMLVALPFAAALFALYLFLQRLVLAPLAQICRYADRVSNGEYLQPPALYGEDEFGTLAETLARMTDNMLLGNHQVIKSLAGALECRDPYTAGHVERVSIYACAVGEKLGLNRNQLMQLEVVAVLHDIGKIGVDDAILRKPGPLDAEERVKMEAHAEIGAAIIPVDSPLSFAIPGILYHHERYDGNGYPRRLAGRAIPILARILAVVDTYDAMTTDRPYRKGLSKREAIAEIMRMGGKQFDPDVVVAFIDASQSFELLIGLSDAMIDNGISDRHRSVF